ncbi:LD-carboxypeptidase [Azospirillum sp. TSH100]|uniref:S66 peptidase family protein n=1 Tax=Azospirillum sp. TSH100 TaxID=652764 RepID=UPI0032B7D645
MSRDMGKAAIQRMKPAKLRPGDAVRLVSPASTPDKDGVMHSIRLLESLGLRVELGRHVFDRLGYLAGRDVDRQADLNEALRDPEVRAIIATRGGKGAYRIADGLDFAAMRADPKPLVGFSEVTILHLALWHHAGVPGIHGACWDTDRFGEESAQSFKRSLLSAEPITVCSKPNETTAALTSHGRASGVLLGGNLDMIAAAAGWVLPRLAGAILLIEDVEKGLGHIDRHLTRLLKAGCLDGIRGIAVGQFVGFNESQGWSVVDVLRDRLFPLGVPILGGLPLGHGPDAVAIPVGTKAVLDADQGTLTVEPAVQ